MDILKRKQYLNRLATLKDSSDIKIITGIRRAGKSILLNSFRNIYQRILRNPILFILICPF